MPCNSDYQSASQKEIELSRVCCLLDELRGKPIKKEHWAGYHPRVYNKWQTLDADSLVAELCRRLQGEDVTSYSLEMQIWWRDHQEADRERLARERQSESERLERRAALSKLTPREIEILGLEDNDDHA